MTAAKRYSLHCFIALLLLLTFAAAAQNKTTMTKETLHSFADAVNAHDVARITALLTSDHTFIDATGCEGSGKDKAAAGWGDYFKLFPDYHIDITDVFVNGDTVAAFGFAQGSYLGNKAHHWRTAASWRAVVHGQQVKTWQVYADTKVPADIIAKSAGNHTDPAPGVTGLGGFFFKCKDPNNVKAWYKQHLHVDASPYGTKFEWRQGSDPSKYGCKLWIPFGEKTTYFAPSAKDYMINYRVAHIEQLVEQLRKDGITILDAIEDSDFGKFVHILDCEQNKVELWEPKDADYDKVVGGK